MEQLCIRCKGKGLCGKPCKILSRMADFAPKIKTHFSGSAPPEIFVGRAGYPDVFSGILSPNQFGDTSQFSLPESWVSNKLSIEQILQKRGQMIYARQKVLVSHSGANNTRDQNFFHHGHIKSMQSRSIKDVMQNLALSSKPVSTEFFLKKSPKLEITASKYFSIMANPAPIQKVILEENPKVPQKVDYITSDYDVNATTALKELYKTGIINSHLNKLLSAGLLGVKIQRKMVPTRWAITAVDDILSKSLLERVRNYPEINEIHIFHSEYNGNHYEFLLLPGSWSFEVIEAWTLSSGVGFSQDYESFYGRKNYASNVTGAYYANRLAILEYLEKIHRQASVLVLRHITEEYYAPLGVGILRETTREAFKQPSEKATDVQDAFSKIQHRFPLAGQFEEKSWLLKNYNKQKKLGNWF